MWGHSKKGSISPLEKGFHQNLIMFVPWSQISTTTTMRNKCMVFVSYSGYRILLKQLDQIKTLPLYLLHGILLRLGCVHIHLPDPTTGSKTVGIGSLFSSSTNKQETKLGMLQNSAIVKVAWRSIRVTGDTFKTQMPRTPLLEMLSPYIAML